MFLRKECVCLFFLCSVIFMSFAGIAVKNKDLSKWLGVWVDESSNETIIFVTQNGGLLEVKGKDKLSYFSCLYVVRGEQAEGFGSGVNFKYNENFLYKSKLTFTSNTLVEEWECLFSSGDTIKGKSTYIRKDKSNLDQR